MRTMTLVRAVSACVLFAGILVTAGWSQPAITGRWSGSFDITEPDGTVHHDTAYLILKQDGAAITGSVGPNEDHRFNITSGKISGSDVQLSVEADDGSKIAFQLHLDGEHLKGDVTGETPEGKLSARIDVTRMVEKASGVNQTPRILTPVTKAD